MLRRQTQVCFEDEISKRGRRRHATKQMWQNVIPDLLFVTTVNLTVNAALRFTMNVSALDICASIRPKPDRRCLLFKRYLFSV